MSAHHAGRRGMVASALTSAAGWLIEPAPAPEVVEPAPAHREPRPVVAVAGLRRGAGVTTLARALGAALGVRDPCGACVVTAAAGGASVPLGLPAGGRLSRRIAPFIDGRARPCGRLCLVEDADRACLSAVARDVAPLVLDVSDPAEAAAAVSVADHVLLVAGPETEPALAAVVAESLGLVGPPPLVVVNRSGRASERWAAEPHVPVPESRLAAQLAGAGREPRGPVGQAVAALAERVGGGA